MDGRLWLVASVVLVAGCVGGNGDGSGDDDPAFVTTSIPLALPGGAPGPASDQFAIGGEVVVAGNATRVLVETQFSCSSPLCEMALVLLDPDGEEACSSSGTNEVGCEVSRPAPGTYALRMVPNSPVVQLEGEARITVFDGPATPGFSAFAES